MSIKKRNSHKVRVGVLGMKRGASFARIFGHHPNTELVAVCDFDKHSIAGFLGDRTDIAVYHDYDEFLEHDMDAVMIAGYCTEHAPQAVKALKAGKHVLSEVTACKTLAEGVALCRAVEESGKVYMLAENYCYFSYVQEMRRLYKLGAIGEYLYGECEYVHDTRAYSHILTDGPDHWRNWLPSTYYCTHSLGPILTITGTRPVKVSGFVIPNKLSRAVGRRGDDGAVLICTMDNGAVTKVIPWSIYPREPASIWYCLYGTKGEMENNRWPNQQVLNIFVEGDSDTPYQKSYQPRFRKYASEAEKTGHGGGDFFVVQEFIEAIIESKHPSIDVYQAMDMTLPGILGYRSAYNGNIPLEVPDFRKEEVRKKYENDHWSPDPKDKNIPGQPSPSILGEIQIPEFVYQLIERRRREAGISLERAYKID